MRDYLEIDTTPCDEPCLQVGTPECTIPAQKEEARRYIAAIKHTLGEPPEGVEFRLSANPHDFGTYYSIKIWFDDEDEEAASYVYRCESDAPVTWPKGFRTPAEFEEFLSVQRGLAESASGDVHDLGRFSQ